MPTVSDIACHATLEALHRRNGAVSIAAFEGEGAANDVRWFRSRVLEYTQDGLTLERPHAPEAGRHIHPGAFVRVLAIDGHQRWLFMAHVRGVLTYALNAGTRVSALDLSPPMEVQSGQRRDFFRVLTVAGGLRPALLTPLPAQPPDGAAQPPPLALARNAPAPGTHGTPGTKSPIPNPKLPIPPLAFPPQPFHATILNVGGGGIGVEAPQRVSPQIHAVCYYRCHLELPTLPNPVEVGARVRHIEPMEGGTFYLGLAFDFLNPAERRQCVDAACRFSAWYQRQQLQRLQEKR